MLTALEEGAPGTGADFEVVGVESEFPKYPLLEPSGEVSCPERGRGGDISFVDAVAPCGDFGDGKTPEKPLARRMMTMHVTINKGTVYPLKCFFLN